MVTVIKNHAQSVINCKCYLIYIAMCIFVVIVHFFRFIKMFEIFNDIVPYKSQILVSTLAMGDLGVAPHRPPQVSVFATIPQPQISFYCTPLLLKRIKEVFSLLH